MGECELGDVERKYFMGVYFYKLVPIFEERKELVRDDSLLLYIPSPGLD